MSRRRTGWALVAAGVLLLAAGLALVVIARGGDVEAPPTGPAGPAPATCVIDRADVDARVAAGADPANAVAELLAECDR